MRDTFRARALRLLSPTVFLFLASSAFGQELVTNGGFETPAIATPTQSPVTLPGWTVIGAAGGKIQNGFGGLTAYEGSQWVELDVTANTTISQDLATTPGQTYLLRYSVGNRTGVSSSQVRVYWGGALVDDHVIANPGWTRVIKLVQATSATTRLQFEARGISDGQGDLLDAVSVAPAGSNVIQNGSFEIPAVGGVSSNVSVSNWTSNGAGNSVRVQRGMDGIIAPDGAQWVELDGLANTNIYQDVSVQPGQTYLLTFAIANRSPSANSSVRVLWNGESQGVFSTPLNSFQVHRLELKAASATQRLEFQAGGAQDGAGDLLDAVTLQPILTSTEFSGVYRIRVKATGRFLHANDAEDAYVSTRYQPDDDRTRFILEKQSDGSYRIRVKATGLFLHEDGLGDRMVSTRFQTNDDNTRFFFDIQNDGSYRIRSKGSNRFWQEDAQGDRLISTRTQPDDDSSRFYLDPAGAAPAASLTSLPSALSFQYTLGGALPSAQTVLIGSTPAGAAFTVDTPSVNWLSVTPSSGTAPASLTISVNPAGLTAGTVSANLTLRSADSLPLSIPVTLTVISGGPATLQATPSALSFHYALGGLTPSSQALTISSSPTGAAFTVDTPAVSWLLVSTLSGTTQSSLTVAVNPNGLPVGTVTSQLVVRSAGSAPITIPVTLNVTSGGTPGTILSASPAAVTANYQPGGVAPLPQSVAVSSTTGSTSFTVDAPNVTWLTVTPTSGTAPAALTLLYNTSGLNSGTFTTQVVVRPTGLSSTAPLTIPVTLTVGSGGAASGSQVLAQVADGGGWQTQVVLVNKDTQAASFTLRFWASTGQPLHLTLEGETSATSTFTGTIPVNGSRTINTAGIAPQTSVGWVELVTQQSVGGVAVFRSGAGQEAAVGLTTPVNRFVLPFDNTAGRVTSMAIVNANASQPVTVNVTLRDEFGGTIGTSTLTLNPRGHDAFELFNRFSGIAGRRGVAEFSTSSADLTGLGLRFGTQGQFTSFPVQTW